MEGSCCSFDKNGRFLALLTPDGRLKLWDCTFGSLKHEYTSPSHLSTTCTCLRWSRTSRSSVSILVPGEIDHVFLEIVISSAQFTRRQSVKYSAQPSLESGITFLSPMFGLNP